MIPEKDLKEAINSRIEVYRTGIRDAFKGLVYGTKQMNEDDFVKWYSLKVREDPYWFLAMQDFPEGRAMGERMNRIMERRQSDGANG